MLYAKDIRIVPGMGARFRTPVLAHPLPAPALQAEQRKGEEVVRFEVREAVVQERRALIQFRLRLSMARPEGSGM